MHSGRRNKRGLSLEMSRSVPIGHSHFQRTRRHVRNQQPAESAVCIFRDLLCLTAHVRDCSWPRSLSYARQDRLGNAFPCRTLESVFQGSLFFPLIWSVRIAFAASSASANIPGAKFAWSVSENFLRYRFCPREPGKLLMAYPSSGSTEKPAWMHCRRNLLNKQLGQNPDVSKLPE